MLEIFITLLLSLIIIFANYKRTRDLFAPAVLFPIVICFSIIIYLFKLSGLQNDYNYIYIVYILSLVFAFIIPSIFKLGGKNDETKKYCINNNRFKFVAYFLFIVVFFSFLVMWMKLGAPPLISKVDRSLYFISGFGTLYLLIDVSNYLLLFDIFSKKLLRKKAVFMLLINIAMILLMSNKTQLFFLICQFLVIYNIFSVSL